MGVLTGLETLFEDFRIGACMLRKYPGFAPENRTLGPRRLGYCGVFFFLKRPPRLLMASAGALPASFPTLEPRPAAQPSCDLSMPAASPPTSGMNLGSA